MIFGSYAEAIAQGRLTSYAFPTRDLGPKPTVLGPTPALPGRVYPVQNRAKADPLGYVEVTAVRLLYPGELTATDTGQFPDIATLRAFAAGRPIFLLSLKIVGSVRAHARIEAQRRNPPFTGAASRRCPHSPPARGGTQGGPHGS